MATENLKHKAYQYIRTKILHCEYGPGEVFVETEAIRALGISRTPIREALSRLEQEGLVRIIPKRGAFISDVTISTVCNVYDVRELVEPHLVQTLSCHIPKEYFQQLYQRIEQIMQTETPSEHYIFDNDLHQLFFKYCSNQYLNVMMDQIYAQNHRIRLLSGQATTHRLLESHEEHRRILNALLKEDAILAAAEMRRHLQIARSVALEAITRTNSMILA